MRLLVGRAERERTGFKVRIRTRGGTRISADASLSAVFLGNRKAEADIFSACDATSFSQ